MEEKSGQSLTFLVFSDLIVPKLRLVGVINRHNKRLTCGEKLSMNEYQQLEVLVVACLSAGILPRIVLDGKQAVKVIEGRPDAPLPVRLNKILSGISSCGHTQAVISGIKNRLGEEDFGRLLTGQYRLETVSEPEMVAPVINLRSASPRKPSPRGSITALRKYSANMM